ncbi:MAG: site-2 protease family protein [Planctomycetes bacterium]|nr:site-2 protease family protein [Planctomycetota bacterium]
MFNLEFMVLYRIPNLLIALTLHEFCHAYIAYKCGDPTAKYQGRLTLNPIAHLDPLGAICLLFAPIGWAKPVPVNPYNFRHPDRDDILVSIAGPLANISVALLMGSILRLFTNTQISAPEIVVNFLFIGVLMNIGIALFNMIPIYPLDGSHILKAFLSYEAQEKYAAFNRIAPFILLVIIIAAPDLLWLVLKPPFSFLFWLFTGIDSFRW